MSINAKRDRVRVVLNETLILLQGGQYDRFIALCYGMLKGSNPRRLRRSTVHKSLEFQRIAKVILLVLIDTSVLILL